MSNNKILLISIFLIVATVIVFWQVNYCDFINYDDHVYVTENGHVQRGLTMDGIRWAFTTYHASNWHPLTWISHMLDVQFFGLKPQWHHLTNLLFHIANTLLLFFVLYRMTNALWQSAFVAALFALHPLHVESVAWVAERKDVVSTFFWMLTMGAYCYYVERPGLRRYLPVVSFFALGLMAKPMLVTLPFILLLLDYWPFLRFEQKQLAPVIQTKSTKPMNPDKRKGKSRKNNPITIKEEVKADKSADSPFRWTMIRPLLWEKVPLFALAVFSSIITYIAQQKGGAVQSIEAFPLSVRISNALVSYITYIGRMIWPNSLAIYYPYPGLWQLWQVLGAVFILIAVTLAAILMAKRFQYLTVGWLWYVGTLVPVIGLVQVGGQASADRYTYIPLIGLFIMVAWGMPTLLGQWRYCKKALIAFSTLTLLCLSIVTWTQVGYWQNNLTLYDHALKVTDNNCVVYINRGNAYAAIGNQQQAIEDFSRAIEINSKVPSAYFNRGAAYAAIGNQQQAIEDYNRAIEINPKYALAYYNRGNAYAAIGNRQQSIEDYDKAIEINPKYVEAYSNRAASYYLLGNRQQAIENYNRAIEINSEFALAYYNRGNVYAANGNRQQAIEDFTRAIDINPKFASSYIKRAALYYSLGNQKQAYEDLRGAAELGDKTAQNLLTSKGISW